MTDSLRTARTVLLTGVTGFLGKVILEELVRRRDELAIKRIVVVIRPLRGEHAHDRFRREVAEARCFAELPADWTRLVTVLEGQLEEPGLGLAPDGAALLDSVTHVVHAAASVKFNLPLARAARVNVDASLNLLELVRHVPKLERFVYVSTAYVTPHVPGAPVEEVLAPLPAPAADLYEACVDGTFTDAELLARTRQPNGYTLTKSIAEHLLVERRGAIPLTIVRPSIITASREHPFPGWIDSTAGYAAFVLFVGTGRFRALVCDPDAKLDLVPVDDVAHRVAHACLFDRDEVVIRHAVVGSLRAPTVAQCWDGTLRYFRLRREDPTPLSRYLGPDGVRYALADLVRHRLPIALSSLRSKRERRQAVKLRARLDYLNQEFTYFTTRTFDFRSSLPIGDEYEAGRFVDTVCRGVYHHFLRRDENAWLLGGRAKGSRVGDLRWAAGQPRGNAWIRGASWMVTKVLRRAVDAVVVDVPSFERALSEVPPGASVVITPSHRSYLDFVLCSYLGFARPDLLPVPHWAATIDFAHIPVVGPVLRSMQAFYVRRGQGKDPLLAGQVRQLIDDGHTLAFFIEGARSRTGEFLPPKRGLLRCLQQTGRSCALLPIALKYDRIPEHDAFVRELNGLPKQRMRLGPLLSWTSDVLRGRVDLGRVHIACGTPVLLDGSSDVHAVSHQVIDQLRAAMTGSAERAHAARRDAWSVPAPGTGRRLAKVSSAK